MSYVNKNDVLTVIPPPSLTDALDDDRDGQEDAGIFDAITASCSQAVDAFLASLYTVPFANPVPTQVKEAAFVFTCERIFDRRPWAEKNPWRDRAKWWRDRLEKIGNNEFKLDAAQAKSFTPGAVIKDCLGVDTSMR